MRAKTATRIVGISAIAVKKRTSRMCSFEPADRRRRSAIITPMRRATKAATTSA